LTFRFGNFFPTAVIVIFFVKLIQLSTQKQLRTLEKMMR
jgi:hypothetical protein